MEPLTKNTFEYKSDIQKSIQENLIIEPAPYMFLSESQTPETRQIILFWYS